MKQPIIFFFKFKGFADFGGRMCKDDKNSPSKTSLRNLIEMTSNTLNSFDWNKSFTIYVKKSKYLMFLSELSMCDGVKLHKLHSDKGPILKFFPTKTLFYKI